MVAFVEKTVMNFSPDESSGNHRKKFHQNQKIIPLDEN